MASQAAPALKAPGIVRKQLQGRLSLVTLDDEGAHGQQWALAGDDGVLQPFVRGVVPPKKDKDGRDVEPGAVVGLVRVGKRETMERMSCAALCCLVVCSGGGTVDGMGRARLTRSRSGSVLSSASPFTVPCTQQAAAGHPPPGPHITLRMVLLLYHTCLQASTCLLTCTLHRLPIPTSAELPR